MPFLKKTFVFWSVALIIVFSSLSYWFPKEGFDIVDERYYWNFPLNTTYYGETDVIWSAGPAKKYPKNRIQIVGGRGTITDFSKSSNKQMFMVNASTNLEIVDNTQYFPGWRVYIDGASVPIEFQNQNHRGLITFSAPPGLHRVQVLFEETKLRIIADLATVFGLFIIITGVIFRKKQL